MITIKISMKVKMDLEYLNIIWLMNTWRFVKVNKYLLCIYLWFSSNERAARLMCERLQTAKFVTCKLYR